MTFGSSNRVALRVVDEVTWGVTPATPTLEALRFKSESLNYNADFTMSEEIRSDRMTPDTVQVSSSAAGDIKGELSYATYDKLIACGMFSNWVTTGAAQTASDISINKTAGTPNTWTLDTVAGDWTNNAFTVGQWVEVAGFAVAGTFFAQITSIGAVNLGINPSKDVADEAAGASVTVTPLNFIRNGTTKKSVTIQKAFTDLDTPELWNFTGARVGKIGLELATGSILNTSFSILAKDAAMTETQFAGASISAANTNTVMNAVDNIASIVFDGDPGGDQYYFQSLSVELDNSLRGQEAVGTLGYIGVEPGSLKLTGSIELYFEDSAIYDRFKAAQAFSLSFVAQDSAGNTYIVTIPRAKFTSMEIVAGGLDQDIFAKGELQGLINSAGTYQVQISRLAA